MIAASEPLEFVPHGRTVLSKHPGQIYGKGLNNSSSENSLMYKLANFAIKDESLLESKDSGEEWWCIREIYYRETGDVDEDETQQSTKEKYEDSFRPPSRIKPEFNISIKSELLSGMKRTEGEPGTSQGGSANSSSNMSKKFNLNSSQNKQPMTKPLNPKTDCSYEEELYVKGCTAVWSKGLISTPGTKLSGPEQRETIACYTIENPIKHAAFCDFHIGINNTMLLDALNSQIGDVKKNIKIEDTTEHIETNIMPSILLMDSKCMRVYAVDGREYITSIPFQVKKVWPMKYGVLLEKEPLPQLHNSLLPTSFFKLNESCNSSLYKSKTNAPFNMSAKLRAESLVGYDQEYPLPTCFSLSHPLDEVIPILIKSPSQGLQYYSDGDVQIIFVSVNPSIILLYDWKLGYHSLWKIRKATREECLNMCPNINSTTTVFSQSCDFVGSPMQSMAKNTTSWNAGSPFQSKKGMNTPNRSRQNSPMAHIFHQQGLSPHASIGQASSTSMLANSINQTPPSLPLYPDICLDHIWTDSQVIRRDQVESPTDIKTFLHTDLVGHNYLCFLVKVGGANKLQILRLQKSHSHGQLLKSNLIVGAVSSVYAKDAVVLNDLKMIALIDESGNIILQSGNSVVGKVHVGGVLARLLDSPYTKRAAHPLALPALHSPFPRRSSLLPSRTDCTFDDSALHLLSPVPHSSTSRIEHKESLGLRGVRDAAGRRVTLCLENGVLYRIALPPLAAAALPPRAALALRALLPRDIAMQVLIKWYGVRNAPGTQDLTPEQEWSMFSKLLLTLIGYDVERLGQIRQSDEDGTEVASKKQRTSSDGTQDDWDYLLNSRMHKAIGSSLACMLNLSPTQPESKHWKGKTKTLESDKPVQFNTNSLLFPYMLQVFYAFHLLYEDLKLNVLLSSNLKPLSSFLYQLAKDLRLNNYVNHYWLDFPNDYHYECMETDSQVSDVMLKKLSPPNYFSPEPPGIFSYLNSMLKNCDVGYYPYLPEVNDTCRDLIEAIDGLLLGCGSGAGVQPLSLQVLGSSTPRPRRDSGPAPAPHAQAALLAAHRGITLRGIDNFPPAIGLMLLSIFNRSKSAPPTDWPPQAYCLVMREDLAALANTAAAMTDTHEYLESLALEALEKETAFTMLTSGSEEGGAGSAAREEELTGMEHLNTKLLTLLYPRDHRMTEVFRLLQSSIPATINLTQRPEVSDHDFIEEQEKFLYAITTRTTALPVARGMVTLRTVPAGATEPARPARLCVTGRGPPPRCHAVTLSDTAPAALLWPSFHNGAAAGLALVPVAGRTIHHSWIVYNKPRGTQDMSAEHAGFLLALGLNGHLRDMPYMNMFDYFVKCNEMISIGLLLGLAATYRGTMDVQATKMMSIHLEALLPPTSIELDIQQNILVAALLGVGLLYQATAHAHYAQVLLNEIGKPPGPELENCVEREGYALAAGLALGLVCVGAGDSAPPHLAPRLRAYVLGGERHAYGREGCGGGVSSGAGGGANVDVTSPGATLALGLLYLRAGQCAPAAWLAPPATPYLLDFVRPDLLMLRVIARGLILWDSIEASEEWVEEQVPATIRPYCFVKPSDDNIDYEAMNQAYCNIISGACFALGLRFAGSGDEDALEAVLSSARRLLGAPGRRLAHLAGAATIETCLCVCLLAAGMIMSGRGDLRVLRLCRRLRARIAVRGPQSSASQPHALSHGAQMAVHCTVGLLFLAGGPGTLSTSRTAVAPLLIAFFPKFPTHSEDNRYHLQAFRHLYVLAVEPRLLLPRDLDTGKLCYAHVQVVDLQGVVKEMKAPCIIPELDGLKEVKINDPRYWPIVFRRDQNWDQLKKFLNFTWCIDIRSFVKHHLHGEHASGAGGGPQGSGGVAGASGGGACADCLVALRRRARGEGVPRVCRCRRYSREEEEHAQALSMLTYQCLVKDSLCALPLWATFLKIIKAMRTEPTSYDVWQMRLLVSLAEQQSAAAAAEMPVDGDEAPAEPLVSAELALALKQRVAALLDDWQPRLAPALRRYAGAGGASAAGRRSGEEARHALAAYVLYHGVRAGQCGAGRARAAALACAPAPPAAAVAALAPLLS
ncbi:Anaphase-promoting complex subunit 1 [Papilio xuthus]|uniref:Anaphase-promoting complex subunit 1 n=1 Tax=Papilio xuthus TaxID=66420 RepID=A0A194PDA3_PAPXU|nr:Anaphase-promoting complex subunit 1 [Papilio xuthus]